MNRSSEGGRRSLRQVRSALATRLRARSDEIQEAIRTRVFSIFIADESFNPEYVAGLRLTISAAVQYGIAAVETGVDGAPALPPILLAQARMAVRNGVSIDAVLRRYFVGYTLLSEFVMAEATVSGVANVAEVQRIGRDQVTIFDRLVVGVSEEYAAETRSRRKSAKERRFERIQALVAGELLDTSEFSYEFEAWNVGMQGLGLRTAGVLRTLSQKLDCQLLLTQSKSGLVWAWFGKRRKISSSQIEQAARDEWPSGSLLAIGEPGYGLSGWRRTHRQARAALELVIDGQSGIYRYADHALIVSMSRDDLLVTSLIEMYVRPLTAAPDGETLLDTLKAYYLEARRNVSSTATVLGISRKTVEKRLTKAEKRLGCPLYVCAAELEGVLRLYEWGLSEECGGRRLGRESLLNSQIAPAPVNHSTED